MSQTFSTAKTLSKSRNHRISSMTPRDRIVQGAPQKTLMRRQLHETVRGFSVNTVTIKNCHLQIKSSTNDGSVCSKCHERQSPEDGWGAECIASCAALAVDVKKCSGLHRAPQPLQQGVLMFSGSCACPRRLKFPKQIPCTGPCGPLLFHVGFASEGV